MTKLDQLSDMLFTDARYEVTAKPNSKNRRHHPQPLTLTNAKLVGNHQQEYLIGYTPTGRRSIGQGTAIATLRLTQVLEPEVQPA